jgi:RNA recognition motif-containing protein
MLRLALQSGCFHLFNSFQMKLFVAKLPYATQSEDLQELFEQYGTVDSAQVILDRETGRSRGFGFVEMPDDEEAKSAIEALDGSELDGREIVVKEAEDRGSGGGNRRGGGGYRGGGNRGGGGGYRGGGGGYGGGGGGNRY